jgi:aldehyde dehydrogenase family 7 protein A1
MVSLMEKNLTDDHILKSSNVIDSRTASIIMADADLSLAVPAVFFGAIGTAGQRCTSTRRLYLQRKIAPEFLSRLQDLYSTIRVGDPLVETTLLGPLHTRSAVNIYTNAIGYLRKTGAEILNGGKRYEEAPLDAGYFVQPTISVPKSMDPTDPIWKTETFAPILNVAIFDELEQAIEWNNSVPQGLSSSLWTRDLRSVGKWIGPSGSDTGIVNVSIIIIIHFFIFLDVNHDVIRLTWVQAARKLGQLSGVTRSGFSRFAHNDPFY